MKRILGRELLEREIERLAVTFTTNKAIQRQLVNIFYADLAEALAIRRKRRKPKSATDPRGYAEFKKKK